MAYLSRRGVQSIPAKSIHLHSTTRISLTNSLTTRFHTISPSNQQPHQKINALNKYHHTLYTHTRPNIHTISSHRKFKKFQPNPSNHNQHSKLFKHNQQYFNAASSQKKDYYETLGLPRDAKDTEVKKTFYKLAKQWHPDANKAPEAKDKFSEINEAYQVLSNKEKRAQYDRFGHDMNNMGGMGGFNAADINLNDLFENLFGRNTGGGGFNPFGDLFGAMGGAQEMNDPNAPQHGRDLQVDVALTFMEAVNGSSRELKLQRFDECNLCKSSGIEAGTKSVKCSTCEGKGRMVQQSGFMVIQQTCWDCNGAGHKHTNCKQCQGSGLSSNVSSLDVNIPAGVDDGTRVRIAGQGHCGKNHGGRGHAWLLCKVKSDERFERNGSDVHISVNVPVYKAMLGGTVTVPTLTGEAEVKVKAGTQSEHREIMRGKGITEPSTGRKGHQYLHFNVAIPTALSDQQRDLIQQFGELYEKDHEDK